MDLHIGEYKRVVNFSAYPLSEFRTDPIEEVMP